MIIIDGPVDFAELHICKQSGWNPVFFQKKQYLPHKVATRQNGLVVVAAVFLCSAQRGVARILVTFSQIEVSGTLFLLIL